jgi:dienelactone hydrolase
VRRRALAWGMRIGARWAWGISVALLILASGPAVRLWKAQQILTRLASAGGSVAAREAQIRESQVVVEDTILPLAIGPVRARVYRPGARLAGPGVVVAHGVHHRGIDEPRLVAFSRALAESGLAILTPELEDLADYRITGRAAEQLAGAVRHFASRSDLVRGGRVGLLGFSFAGGLSLLAAGDPNIDRELAWVASVGGHHDLARVLRFFAENRVETPKGVAPKQAHEYGAVVLLYGHLDRFVPEQDRALMRSALGAWLREDRPTARALAARRVTAEGERLFELIESHRLADLHVALEPLISEYAAELDRLSPRGKLHLIRSPVYLLHGAGDSVIPASETEWADLELGPQRHRALVSPLLEHVEVGHGAGLVEKLELVEFMAHLVSTDSPRPPG